MMPDNRIPTGPILPDGRIINAWDVFCPAFPRDTSAEIPADAAKAYHLWANHIETGRAYMSAADATNCGQPELIKKLTDQVLRVRELRQKAEVSQLAQAQLDRLLSDRKCLGRWCDADDIVCIGWVDSREVLLRLGSASFYRDLADALLPILRGDV